MTKLEKLVALFGSQQRLATAIGMTRGRVSQWLQPWKHHRDTLPPHLNDRVRKAVMDWPMNKTMEVDECLEDACPTCGRAYDDAPHDHFTPPKATFQKVPYAGKE